MTVGDVRRIAHDWALANLPAWPRVVGALLAGSINFKADDAPWSSGSDIDLWVYQSGEPSPRLRKFEHAGVIFEVSSQSADVLADDRKVLSSAHTALHVALGQIVFDPVGTLRQLHERVAPEFARLEWIRARMAWASKNSASKYQRCIDAGGESLVGPLCVFVLGIRNAAALSAIAALDNPTLRRCLVLQRQQLTRHGFDSLHEEALEILGSSKLCSSDVRDMLVPLGPLFRRACAVAKTPFWAIFELEPAAESLFISGVREMIDSGHPREAVLFVLFIHYFCHQAIQNDGSAADKVASNAELMRALDAVGIHSLADTQERSRRGLGLLGRLQQACDTIARAHAAVD